MKLAEQLDFSIDCRRYSSDDPDNLHERLVWLIPSQTPMLAFNDFFIGRRSIENDFLEFNSGAFTEIDVAPQRSKLVVP